MCVDKSIVLTFYTRHNVFNNTHIMSSTHFSIGSFKYKIAKHILLCDHHKIVSMSQKILYTCLNEPVNVDSNLLL